MTWRVLLHSLTDRVKALIVTKESAKLNQPARNMEGQEVWADKRQNLCYPMREGSGDNDGKKEEKTTEKDRGRDMEREKRARSWERANREVEKPADRPSKTRESSAAIVADMKDREKSVEEKGLDLRQEKQRRKEKKKGR